MDVAMRKTALDTNREHFPRGELALYKPFYSKHTHTHTPTVGKHTHTWVYVCVLLVFMSPFCHYFGRARGCGTFVGALWCNFSLCAAFKLCDSYSRIASSSSPLHLLPHPAYPNQLPSGCQPIGLYLFCIVFVALRYFASLGRSGKFLSAICSRT